MKRRDPERMKRLSSLILPLLVANSDPVHMKRVLEVNIGGCLDFLCHPASRRGCNVALAPFDSPEKRCFLRIAEALRLWWNEETSDCRPVAMDSGNAQAAIGRGLAVRAGERPGTEKGTMICAWCRRPIGSQSGIAEEGHGICPECKTGQFPDPDTERRNLDATAVQMKVVSYKGTQLAAVQPIDRLSNNQLEILVAHQKKIGREVIFELVW